MQQDHAARIRGPHPGHDKQDRQKNAQGSDHGD
jgi:hypothetical protein